VFILIYESNLHHIPEDCNFKCRRPRFGMHMAKTWETDLVYGWVTKVRTRWSWPGHTEKARRDGSNCLEHRWQMPAIQLRKSRSATIKRVVLIMEQGPHTQIARVPNG
jgi:hypothetical protein